MTTTVPPDDRGESPRTAAGADPRVQNRWRWLALPSRSRWAFLLPALAGFLFVGHAWEDAGPAGAAPYALVFLVSLASFIYPNVLSWGLAAILCGAYTGMILAVPFMGITRVPLAEWIIFFLIGFVPCAALWWARPPGLCRRRRNARAG